MNNLSRLSLLALGWVLLGIGLAGLFIPFMPSTIFILMSAFCFCKSSPKIHAWLRNHPRFGENVREWEDRGAIDLKIKFFASSAIVVPVGVSVMFFKLHPAWIFTIVFIGGSIVAYIFSRPSE